MKKQTVYGIKLIIIYLKNSSKRFSYIIYNTMINGKLLKVAFIKKNNIVITVLPVDDYMNMIHAECEKTIPDIKNLKKITNDDLVIPTINTYDIILNHNFSVQQLKTIAKNYKLKMSGTKKELVSRIYIFLKLSSVIIKIQKLYRGNLQRKCVVLHGPAYINRSLCTNDSDFLTGDEVKDLKCSQFFSYKDVDGFIYGFDIISLYNLIIKSEGVVKNPYNRNNISNKVIQNIRSLIRISKMLKIKIDIDIQDVSSELSTQKNAELRILDLFQNINALGNYSEPIWFSSLNKFQIIRLLRDLTDIWSYRAQLSPETKRTICPPDGNPFRNINYTYLHNEPSEEKVKQFALDILERFVNTGIDRDNKSLGAYYVLGALTLINENAAVSLPWLYQSVSYI